MKLNLNQITIQVNNVEKSIDFYKKLGLKLIVNSTQNYARFECLNGDTTFSLHQSKLETNNNSTWIYFETENLDSDVKTLTEKGICIEEMPNDKPWLWREARIRDLDNNLIILYYAGKNRKNPPWRL